MNTSNKKQATNQVTIALDAMGGDHGPSETVKAAIESIGNDSSLNIALVGDIEEISDELKKYPTNSQIQIIPSKGYIKESESFESKSVKAAAARARKALGNMGKLAKERRKEIQEKKNSL